MTYTRVVPLGPRGEIAAADAPTANERVAWGARLSDLRASMAAADRNAVEAMVGSLLAGYPAGRGHRDEPTAVMLMFVQALAGLPHWAISSACSSWNRGDVPGKNTSFAPSPSELREVALAASSGFSREMLMIGKILGAEVVEERESDEMRERVAARVRKWVEERKSAAEDARWNKQQEYDPINPKDNYDAWEARKVAELKAEAAAGAFRLSPEALATFNKDHLDSVAVDDPGTAFERWDGRAA